MTNKTPAYIFKSVSINSIDLDDRLTSFSLGTPADSLQQSIKEVGVTHPCHISPNWRPFSYCLRSSSRKNIFTAQNKRNTSKNSKFCNE